MLQRAVPFPLLIPADAALLASWRAFASRLHDGDVLEGVLHRHADRLEIQTRSEARAVLHSIHDMVTRGEHLLWRSALTQIAGDIAALLPPEPEIPAHHPSTREIAGHRPAVYPPPAVPQRRSEPAPEARAPAPPAPPRERAAYQQMLASLGARLGLHVVVPGPGEPRTQAWHACDLVWLEGGHPFAAFVFGVHPDASATILALSDTALSAGTGVRLYLVGGEQDGERLTSALSRPTFRQLRTEELFSFLPFERLCARLEAVGDLVEYLRPEFLDRLRDEQPGAGR
ncbi:MAG TPA: hypothetical protein VFL93_00970 [Longimicrobiaceae bacterium]|nr:hypothetical protein [Longimicrobiaceae bacterium]